MRPLWIEGLIQKGYRLYHPTGPHQPFSDEEAIMYLAEYAQRLERRLTTAAPDVACDPAPLLPGLAHPPRR